LRFLGEVAERYVRRVNLVVAPCVSPWGYEVIHRWNPDAVDPNRSFVAGSRAQECSALMRYVQELDAEFALHIDLHETTDTDAKAGLALDHHALSNLVLCGGIQRVPEWGVAVGRFQFLCSHRFRIGSHRQSHDADLSRVGLGPSIHCLDVDLEGFGLGLGCGTRPGRVPGRVT
jgi:hypothetical protein